MEKAILALILLSGGVSAHTWLESLRLIGANGAFTGAPGFPRGFISRQDPSYSDDVLTYRITAKDAATPLCHPSQQLTNGYVNPQFPRLKASAGSFVAFTYQENGHVSAPQVPEGRPYRSGNVYVYASTSLRDEEFSDVHGNWSTDGELKSGRLLGTHFYDDDSCYQNQGSAGTPINVERKAAAGGDLDSIDCQTDIQLPEDIDSDKIVVYWVWDWSLWPSTEKETSEYYVACAEIDISEGSPPSEVSVDGTIPLNERAVQSQLNTQFEVFDLGTGASAPPSVTVTKPNSQMSPSPTAPSTFATSTVSKADESGLTTIYVPSATVTVTVTAAGPTA